MAQCVIVRCGALRCVAVRCSALQCVTVGCSVLQSVAVYCNVLQRVAEWCSVLQCVSVCCGTLSGNDHLLFHLHRLSHEDVGESMSCVIHFSSISGIFQYERLIQFSLISFIFQSDWSLDPQDARPFLASQCGRLYPDPFSQPLLFGRRGTDHLPYAG